MTRSRRARACRLAAATLLGLAMIAQARGQSAETLDLCAYRLVFDEDFSDFRVAPRQLGDARWIAHTPWNGDFGDAAFSDPGPDGPFSVSGHTLSITARKSADGRWRSGLIAAADGSGKGSGVRYGYFEASLRMPPGPGTWPAFWLGTLKPGSDQSPGIEIDVIEYYGHADGGYRSAVHVWYEGKDKPLSRHRSQYVPVEPGSLVTGFHSYGARVTPEAITFYLDRRPVWRTPTPPEHRLPLFPLLNLALGSGFSIKDTPNPSVLQVGRVRIYEAEPTRAARCPAAGP
ncbi:glycoside hydrolase family 16 protein [Burkholderia sp. A1]|uniref:glycoside hydrolase family 16 protein n=1 Tax=Burkholderia sp. A1 TaxID=148446 RepID=UPI00046A4AC7|nr:glycoside hydrolase family 16 protein [Burkholderia sp. A1]